MNMPGFTAESSVYRTMGYYRAMAGHLALSANAAVLPQLARQLKLLQCLGNCALADAPDYCQQQCFWEESIAASEEHFGGAGKKQRVQIGHVSNAKVTVAKNRPLKESPAVRIARSLFANIRRADRNNKGYGLRRTPQQLLQKPRRGSKCACPDLLQTHHSTKQTTTTSLLPIAVPVTLPIVCPRRLRHWPSQLVWTAGWTVCA